MRLADVTPDEVVQNDANKSFYRMVRLEGHRVRIRPLELFPNGILIQKPTDTIVEGSILVTVIGIWSEDMTVPTAGAPVKKRETLERELEREKVKLESLNAEIVLPKHLGSHRNKVINCEHRIRVLERGLKPAVEVTPQALYEAIQSRPPFLMNQIVILPSGRPGRFLGFAQVAPGIEHAHVQTKTGSYPVPPDVLLPLESRYTSTV